MPKINLKNGDLSAYGFMCGYVQSKPVGTEVEIKNPIGRATKVTRFAVRLFAADDNLYHIQIHDWRQPFGLRAWKSYKSLTEARKEYKKACKFYEKFDGEPYVDRRFFTGEEEAEWNTGGKSSD